MTYSESQSNQKRKGLIVAIDGPAGSGKSTTARLIAQKLGWLYLDTGAMYRAMTVKVLREGIPLDEIETIGQLADKTKIELISSHRGTRVFLNGEEITSHIRTSEVDKAVGPVCEVPKVREVMVDMQRRIGERGNIIAEGRDIGTIVFPDADFKFYMVASLDARSQRRRTDLKNQNVNMSLEQIREEIERRDQRDMQRNNSPLMRAKDAYVLDTSHMTIEKQVDFIIEEIHSHC